MKSSKAPKWLDGRPALKWSLVGFSIFAVVVSAISVLWVVLNRPQVPDPASAEMTEVVDFMKTDAFRSLSTTQRKQYRDGLVERFASMSQQERLEAGRTLRNAGLSRRDREGVQIGVMRHYVDEYMSKTPQERAVFMNNAIQMAERMGGNRMQNEYNRFKNDSEYRKKRVSRGMSNLSRGLHNTSAKDRAKMAKAFQDMAAAVVNKSENP